MAKYTNVELANLVASSTEFDTETKAQLIKVLKEKKTYGLVWEENVEDAYEAMRQQIPIFHEVKSRAVISENKLAPNHILIEGDNIQAISSLIYTHESKVDVIYIDPPYNTGASNWKYNNDYVNKDDQYRHSKFISFMDKRLRLAHKLLSGEGVIICAIDDYEIHNVRQLMDDIFGEDNRLGTITVVHNPRGRNDDTFIATMHEYLLVYAKDAYYATINDFPLSDEDIAAYKKEDEISRYNETSFIRTGNNSLRIERPGLWYEIYYNPTTNKMSLERTSTEDVVLLPINEKGEERCWRWGPETFNKGKDTELFVKLVKGNYKVYKKRRLTEETGKRPRTVWADSKYDASSNGIMLLQKIFNGKCPFPYPKSIHAVYDILHICSKPNSVILDFFAGSGTTMHATMMLNSVDGGNRQCILVTNNENHICEEVTYERNKRVILGYQPNKGAFEQGLTNNSLRYYKTELHDRSLTHQNKKTLFCSLTETICIKENCYTESKCFGNLKLDGKEHLVRYFEDGSRKVLMIYDSRVISYVVNEILLMSDLKDNVKVYIFADGVYPYTEDFKDILDKVNLVPMPGAMLTALKYILPDQNEIMLEKAELTTDEINDEMNEAERIEEGRLL